MPGIKQHRLWRPRDTLIKLIAEKESFVKQQTARLAGQDIPALSDPQALRTGFGGDPDVLLDTHRMLGGKKSAVQEKIIKLTAKLGDVDKDVQMIDSNQRMIRDIEAHAGGDPQSIKEDAGAGR